MLTHNLDYMFYVEYGLPVSAVLFTTFFFILDSKAAPRWYTCFTTVSVGVGLVYTYILIELLIDGLNTFGVLFNLRKSFVGLTVLATGNALPDA